MEGINLAKNKNTKVMFVLPDQHYARGDCLQGGVDKAAESVALQACKLIKPDIFVNLGDAGEWSSVSPYEFAKRSKRPSAEVTKPLLRRDIEAVNDGLDRWDKVIPKNCEKHFIEGNHELWLRNYAEEEAEPGYLPQRAMRLAERGYRFHPYGEYVKFNSLRMYHGGHYDGEAHAKVHLLKTGVSVLYGHNHGKQEFGLSTLDGERSAWCIGCIAKLKKPFLKGRPTDWRSCFATVHLYDDNTYQVTTYDIIRGRCNVWGKEIVA